MTSLSPEAMDHLKSALEAILFVSDKPVRIEQCQDIFPEADKAVIRQALGLLQKEYEEARRGMVILEIAGGYQMLSSPRYAPFLRDFFKVRIKERLSRPALEVLAIIAYNQPVSRADVEAIRGVNSDGVVNHLLSKNLIKIVGRKEVPGRPFLYGTTKEFLEYFGLKSLNDLPRLEEVARLLEQREDRHHQAGDIEPPGVDARPSDPQSSADDQTVTSPAVEGEHHQQPSPSP